MAGASTKSNHPSIRRIFTWPLANKPKNTSKAAFSEGSEACVLTQRRNSSCSRSMAFVVRNDLCWLAGKP